MSVLVTGIIHSLEQAQRAHSRLLDDGIPAANIETRVHTDDPYDDGHHPLGAVAIFGTDLLTLPATGRNMVGNSTTVDLGLEEFVEVFSSVDDPDGAISDDLVSSGVIMFIVRVPDGGTANRVARILEEHGGDGIEVTLG